MIKYYLEYPINKDDFSKDDLEASEILKTAGQKIGDLFEQQVDHDFPGANFYPSDSTKEEIEQAAKSNQAILDPYTVVKRDASGKLYAVYYHEEYKTELTEISALLTQASAFIKNASFKHFLQVAAVELLKGNYAAIEEAWVAIENSSFLHLMIGPIGAYADRLFSLKRAYNFNLTYSSNDTSFNPENYVDIIKNMLPHFGSGVRQDIPSDKIKIRLDKVLAIGGRNASLPARATNYPNEKEVMQKIGLKIVIYTNNIQKRDGEVLLPLFKGLMLPSIVQNFNDELFMANAVRLVMVHEVTEGIFQYDKPWDRLKSMFNAMRELHASIVGIKACGFQVIKGALSEKDLEAMMYAMLIRTFSDYFVRKHALQVESYLVGYRVFFNYCLENGAITIKDGLIDSDPSKMYLCVDQIANKVIDIFSTGLELDAKEFFDKYSSEQMYNTFSAKLSTYEF